MAISWCKRFQYEEGKDQTTDVRSALLVVSTLIAAVTFQAGVNPPGGVWQDTGKTHVAGRAIYATHPSAYSCFLFFNTMALSNSILVIISLTSKFPFWYEVIIATLSMLATYASALFAVTPRESVKFRYIIFAAFLPVILRAFVFELFKYEEDSKDVSPSPANQAAA